MALPLSMWDQVDIRRLRDQSHWTLYTFENACKHARERTHQDHHEASYAARKYESEE